MTALLLAACMLTALTGCAGSGQTGTDVKETEETTAAEQTAEAADTAAQEETATPSLEEQMDSYWNDQLDGDLKNEAGYPHGSEGMGAVVLAMKDGEVIFEKAYGHPFEGQYPVPRKGTHLSYLPVAALFYFYRQSENSAVFFKCFYLCRLYLIAVNLHAF